MSRSCEARIRCRDLTTWHADVFTLALAVAVVLVLATPAHAQLSTVTLSTSALTSGTTYNSNVVVPAGALAWR